MEMSEFLDRGPAVAEVEEELDVQKAVVESLAADKAEQDERIVKLQKEISDLKSQISDFSAKISDLVEKNENLVAKNEEQKVALEKVGDVLAANADETTSSKIALLDRAPELDDRFPGETRDHVLEVIREAREEAEKDGRLRRAQILESVLVVNEPSGTLAKKRGELEKLFNESANVLTGPVIEELQKMGIAYKNGEEYLLTTEILKRIY